MKNATLYTEGSACSDLSKAAQIGVPFIRPFIDAGANVNVQDERGYTVLFYAIAVAHREATSFLLSSGADPAVVGFKGETIFSLLVDKMAQYTDKQFAWDCVFQPFFQWFQETHSDAWEKGNGAAAMMECYLASVGRTNMPGF